MFKSILPSPIRSLPWRLRWLSSTASYTRNKFLSVAKLVLWTLNECMGRDMTVITKDGHRFLTMPNNFTSLCVYLTGERDSEIACYIKKNFTEGDVFIDIGANIGVYTALGSQVVGRSGKVLSFEPNPSTFIYLENNVHLNDLENVQLFKCALGETSGTIGITPNAKNAGETHIAVEGQSRILVPIRKLDDVLAELDVKIVHYIKIDVEGYELQVLRGSIETIRSNPKIVIQTELVLSHARRYGYSLNKIIELLTSLEMEPFMPQQNGALKLLHTSEIGHDWDVLWMRDPLQNLLR